MAIQLSGEGSTLFDRVTAASVGKRLGFVIDGELISVPRIMERIPNGRVLISGLSREEARRIVYRINGETDLMQAERPSALATGGVLLGAAALLIARRRAVASWRMDIPACVLLLVAGNGLLAGPLLTFALAQFGVHADRYDPLASWPSGPIALIIALVLIIGGAMQWRHWRITLAIVDAAFGILLLVMGLLLPGRSLPSELLASVRSAYFSASTTLLGLAGGFWLLPRRWSREPSTSDKGRGGQGDVQPGT